MTGQMPTPDLSGLRIREEARREPRRRRWWYALAGILVLLVAGGGVYVWLGEGAPVVEVATVRADQGGRPALLNASGYVTPRRRATIAAKITARVNEIYAEEGTSSGVGRRACAVPPLFSAVVVGILYDFIM